MSMARRGWTAIPVLALLVAGCATTGGGTGKAAGNEGTITAVAAGIAHQKGNIYAVAAFDYDWRPGAEHPPIAIFREGIPSDDYSASHILAGTDSTGQQLSEAKSFAPGLYSVVFSVSPEGSPPKAVAEIRVTVNGNMTVNAPPWNDWQHF